MCVVAGLVCLKEEGIKECGREALHILWKDVNQCLEFGLMVIKAIVLSRGVCITEDLVSLKANAKLLKLKRCKLQQALSVSRLKGHLFWPKAKHYGTCAKAPQNDFLLMCFQIHSPQFVICACTYNQNPHMSLSSPSTDFSKNCTLNGGNL